MRVDEPNLTGVGAPSYGKTPETREVDRAGEQRRSGSVSGGVDDQVELSNLAGRLSRSMGLLEARQSKCVEELTQTYGSGGYQVEPLSVARAIVAEMRALPENKPAAM